MSEPAADRAREAVAAAKYVLDPAFRRDARAYAKRARHSQPTDLNGPGTAPRARPSEDGTYRIPWGSNVTHSDKPAPEAAVEVQVPAADLIPAPLDAPPSDSVSFGGRFGANRLQETREAAGKSRADLAAEAAVPAVLIERAEQEDFRPNESHCESLAAVLDAETAAVFPPDARSERYPDTKPYPV